MEALESALRFGGRAIDAQVLDDDGNARETWKFSATLHCATRHPLRRANPSTFSFKLAARRLRDLPRLRPGDRRRLTGWWSGREEDAARRRWSSRGRPRVSPLSARHGELSAEVRLPLDTPWNLLAEEHRSGDGPASRVFSGKCRRSERHSGASSPAGEQGLQDARCGVLLSRYRAYTPFCTNLRLQPVKPDALLWRVGAKTDADAALAAVAAGSYRRYKPVGAGCPTRNSKACRPGRSTT